MDYGIREEQIMEHVIITKLKGRPPRKRKPPSAFEEVTGAAYHDLKAFCTQELTMDDFMSWLLKIMILFTIVHLIYKYAI